MKDDDIFISKEDHLFEHEVCRPELPVLGLKDVKACDCGEWWRLEFKDYEGTCVWVNHDDEVEADPSKVVEGC